jgi:PleD family two-component response regulator
VDSEDLATIVNSDKLLKDWTQNYLFAGIDVFRVSK